jgi:hypothetical protein
MPTSVGSFENALGLDLNLDQSPKRGAKRLGLPPGPLTDGVGQLGAVIGNFLCVSLEESLGPRTNSILQPQDPILPFFKNKVHPTNYRKTAGFVGELFHP